MSKKQPYIPGLTPRPEDPVDDDIPDPTSDRTPIPKHIIKEYRFGRPLFRLCRKFNLTSKTS
jgi:hypothetical protein